MLDAKMSLLWIGVGFGIDCGSVGSVVLHVAVSSVGVAAVLSRVAVVHCQCELRVAKWRW